MRLLLAILMSVLINSFNFAVAAADPATVSYVGVYNSPSGSSTSKTITSGNIGSAEHVLVVAYTNWGPDRPPTGVTIGGTAATLIDFGQEHSFWYIAAAPMDTTPDVVFTFASAVEKVGVAVYGLTNLESTTPTATDHGQTTTNNLSVAVEAGGVVVLTAFGNSSPVFSFNPTITVHFEDEFYSAANVQHTGWSRAYSSADTCTEIVTTSGAPVKEGALVAFR